MKYSIKNSSVFCSVLGIMLLIVGFNGLMAEGFSKNIQEIGGVDIISLKKAEKFLKKHDKACIIGRISADDAFFMPDNKNRKVVSGSLQLILSWKDGSQNVLINMQKQSELIKFFFEDDSSAVYITPKNILTAEDTAIISEKLVTGTIGNFQEINYCGYQFSVPGVVTKGGKPKMKIVRKTLEDGEKVAVIITRSDKRSTSNQLFDVQEVIPYANAEKSALSDTGRKKIYIIILVLGVIMFFIPEKTVKL